jgi:hypothetical protein
LGQTLSLESIANGVFGLADFTLNLASGPFGGTFGLGLPITGDLADGFLYGSLDLLGTAFDLILIHLLLRSSFVHYAEAGAFQVAAARGNLGLPEDHAKRRKYQETRYFCT